MQSRASELLVPLSRKARNLTTNSAIHQMEGNAKWALLYI